MYVIFGKKIRLNYKRNFPFFIDLFAFLRSIVLGEFCSVNFCFFYGALNYLDVFLVHVYAIKCVN